jgi:hypothetical protein
MIQDESDELHNRHPKQVRATSDPGFDLGPTIGSEQVAGFEERVQAYQHDNIYWHPNAGTHEVHGGIPH